MSGAEMEIDLTKILTRTAIKRLRKAERAKPTKPTPELKVVQSPWKAVAAVLIISEITCTCGTQWPFPAADTPLVRFIHKRNGTVWEVAHHPALMRPDLPKETRTQQSTVQACANCWAVFKDPYNA